ncbi:hypothetical protein PG985_006490 [Apiospora marii]|uniref:Uncharacterized protein n=1 Tax=Apiospora marii TaxID=335849 RepID=A0ABR1S7S9_9PEZI
MDEDTKTSPPASTAKGPRVVRRPEELDEHEVATIQVIITKSLAQQGDAGRSATEGDIDGFTQAAISSLWDTSQDARAPTQTSRSGFALQVGRLVEDAPASPPGAKREQPDTDQNSPRKRQKTSDKGSLSVLPHRAKGAAVYARVEINNDDLAFKILDKNMSIIKQEWAEFQSKDGKFDKILQLRVIVYRDTKETEYVKKWNKEVLIRREDCTFTGIVL